ncbi:MULTISPECIES: hypothetical protein [Brevibacillus]|jgi:hypothetical protein|uniref:Amidase n=1 Tax=Brevibacillus borstelensis AK1 TaxID=1300222 RepID=M8DHA1_9BACL|nr:hypothetical protein [Brevibacillus borstelensis]EMT52827.1 hypothetical protein I532_08607 [Brevibacillus borstelensis AK1]MBE5397197.1 hypothetical protein [Brevibacillus borstelensis]MCM3470622.1 hypothetical protein [Brevibacillus borstelensis]MCM3623231.1 hypothetical protein [Brevibacillus borstelensis]MED1743553.1 hypothetical protein [Brevibacillus borstelensis]
MKQFSRTALFFLMFPALFLTGFSSGEKPVKATWLWQTYQTASAPDQIVAFAAAKGVNLLYLKIDTSLRPSYYHTFIQKARANGMEVHALGGKSGWGLERNRPEILSLVDWVGRYNQTVETDAAITGIHLDIEPYTLPEWKSDQNEVIRQWMGNVNAYVTKAKELDPSLQVGCDIPFWLDKTALPDQPVVSISEWLISRHDHVTVMAYRDRAEGPNSISALVTQELEMADRLGKKVIVAVETKESNEGNFVSFYEEGTARMEDELSKLSELLASHPSFAGVAIHSYEYWSVLKE